jgi:hypothetical protein
MLGAEASMKRVLWAVFATALFAQPQAKVGTFDKPSIVVAYYRSEMWGSVLREKRAEQQKAKDAGDAKRVAELEKWGVSHQDLAHKQLAGEAPIDNIVEALKPHFAEVAARAGVKEIVVDAPKGVAAADVTGLLLDVLKADEKTRKIVEEMRKHPRPVRVH